MATEGVRGIFFIYDTNDHHMKMSQFSSPILLLVFNRPDYLSQQIAILRQIKPSKLFISGDGPRAEHSSDKLACQKVRTTLKEIDWPCKVMTNFRSKNLGCKMGVSSGIDWFFSHVSEGIILEDDCLPDVSFFQYTQELLQRYRQNKHVGLITGSNVFGEALTSNSYFFSTHPSCWGWATWRRAWQKYDVTMKSWSKDDHSFLHSLFPSSKSQEYWINIFDKTHDGQIDTWDYQWVYTCWKNKMLCAVPVKNLVQNIGFDQRATHTKVAFSPLAHLPKYTLSFPLKHPTKVATDLELDEQIQQTVFEKNIHLKMLGGLQRYCQRFLSTMLEWKLRPMPQSPVIHIKPQQKWYLLDLGELWKFRELFLIFAWRDVMVRYKQTFVGVGWVIFQPLINTIIFTIFFSNFAKVGSGGLPYPMFVLLGLIFWTFFSTSLSHAANSFIENTSILGKVYFPREILPWSSIAVGLVDFSISTVLFLGLALYYRIPFSLAFLGMVGIGLVITIIASAGLGLLLASINVKYRDVRYILPYFLQMMIFVTPVIYPLGVMRPSLQRIVLLNPMAGVIDGLRSALVTGHIINPGILLMSFVSSVVLLAIGLIYFRKTQAFFADLL